MNIYLLIEALSETEKKELKDYFLKTEDAMKKEIEYKNSRRITIKEFCDAIYDDLPPVSAPRIINTLRAGEDHFKFIDAINRKEMLCFRNFGYKSWNILEPILKRAMEFGVVGCSAKNNGA